EMRNLLIIITLFYSLLLISEEKSIKSNIDSGELIELLSDGERLVKTQNWDKAKTVYKNVLKKDPNNKNAREILKYIDIEILNRKKYLKGVSFLNKRDYLMGKNSFNSIPLESTYYSLSQKRLEEMFEYIISDVDKKILKKRYNDAKYLLGIAKSIKDNSEAVNSRLSDIEKKTAKKITQNSQSKNKNSKYNRENAIILVEEARKISISNPKLTVQKSLEAIELDPTYSESYLMAGFAYKNLKQRERAVEYLNKYLKVAPNAPNSEGIRNLIKSISN
ncbi:tetratricopeptide repeat protein, partial [bacterium]|nr:tetratricopeptide repeat protein [bacterium]